MKNRKMMVGIGVGLAVASAGLIGTMKRRPGATAAREQVDETRPSPVQNAGRSGCRFSPDQTLAYDVTVETSGQTQAALPGAVAAPDAVMSALHARLDMRALDVDKTGTVFLARYQNIQTQQDRVYLDAPFLLKIDGSCKIAGFARLRSTPVAAARNQQVVAHELQWQWPDVTSDGQGQGANAVGRFVASYQFSYGGRAVERQILSYTAVWTALPSSTTRDVAAPKASQLIVEPGENGWFEALRGFEKVAGIAAMDSETRTYARQIPPHPEATLGQPTDQASYLWEDLLGRVQHVRPGHEVTKAELDERERAKNLTFAQGISQYLDRAKNEPNFALTWPPLTAYLETHPGETKRFGQSLRSGEIPTELAAPAYVALGQTRTDEARELLLEFMRDESVPVLDRARSTFALIDRDDVGLPLATELAHNAMAIASGNTRPARLFARESALALGAMAGLRADDQPEVMALAVKTVPSLLNLGKSASVLSPVFGAIANMGNVEMLDQVKPYMNDKDPDVRTAAAKVFRRLQPGQSGSMAAGWLSRETDPHVKRAIYMTLAKQTRDAAETAGPEVLDRAIADLNGKPGLLSRKAMLRLLGAAVDTYPPARAALIRQLPIEAKDKHGLYAFVAEFLSPADIEKGMGL